MELKILGAGASKGLISALREKIKQRTGYGISGTFSAVRAIEEKFLGGEPCDVLILAETQFPALLEKNLIVHSSVIAIGSVQTAVAVPQNHYAPDISDEKSLRNALLQATFIYIPDPVKATAGRHVMSVISNLGIESAVHHKLRPHANGETAMRALSEQAPPEAIGITQVTEIKYTKGLTLVAPLPAQHALSTIYSAGVSNAAPSKDVAHIFAELLTSIEVRETRENCGFDSAGAIRT